METAANDLRSSAELEAHRRVTSVIKILLERDGVTQRTLGDAIGMNKSSMSKAMKDPSREDCREWRVGEIVGVARFFRVPPSLFLESEFDELPNP